MVLHIAGQHFTPCVLVVLPVAVIRKYSEKSNLKLIFAHSLRVLSITVGEAWLQEGKARGRIACIGGKPRRGE